MRPRSVAPQEIAWWDRLLIRMPVYLLFSFFGVLALAQPEGAPHGLFILLYFLVVFPLVAGWQIYQVMQGRKRTRAWQKEQRIAQGNLGIPDVREIQARLTEISVSKADLSPPKKPLLGIPGIFLATLAIAAVGICVGILLANLGMGKLSSFAIIAFILAALGPMQLMGVQNRAYRALTSLPRKLGKIQVLINSERCMSSTQRTTQSADSALDASLQIVNEAIGHAKNGHLRAAAECTELLQALSTDCFAAESKPAILIHAVQQRVNGALAQLAVEERKSAG